jgi:hypothetical protein
MLRVYPERGDYTSDIIRGLPVIVTSHRGSSAFNISPVQGESKLRPVVDYTYDLEKITPYSYSVFLDEANIQVNFAPSHRSAVYEITFDKEGDNFIVINTRSGKLSVTENGVSGYQTIGRGATRVYVHIEPEQKPVSTGILTNEGVSYTEKTVDGRNRAVVLKFGKEQKIRLRYGVSFIDEQQAAKNLKTEINTFDWKQVAQKGRDSWNNTLNKIAVTGKSDNDKTVFYTSLYRTYERMINISEDVVISARSMAQGLCTLITVSPFIPTTGFGIPTALPIHYVSLSNRRWKPILSIHTSVWRNKAKKIGCLLSRK